MPLLGRITKSNNMNIIISTGGPGGLFAPPVSATAANILKAGKASFETLFWNFPLFCVPQPELFASSE